jgi:hypothetical protein
MAYADVAELMRWLNLSPQTADSAALQRTLDAAAEEIDWELGYSVDAPAPVPPSPLVVHVNLARAVELWREGWSGHGVVSVGPEALPIVTARDSWYRHARTLAPLKAKQGSWGVA